MTQHLRGGVSWLRVRRSAIAVALLLSLLPPGGRPAGAAAAGEVIYFSRDCDLMVADPSGGEAANVTPSTPDTCDFSPSVSRTGEFVAYVKQARTSPWGTDVWIYDASTGRHRSLTPNGRGSAPDFSPVADVVAYHSPSGGATNIFSVGADGSGLSQHTHDVAPPDDSESGLYNWRPAWDPTGTKLYFTSTRDGYSCRVSRGGYDDISLAPQLYVTTLQGSATRLTNNPRRAYWAVAAHGEKLATVARDHPAADQRGYCTSEPPASAQLMVDNRVVASNSAYWKPSWSKDGTSIAYGTMDKHVAVVSPTGDNRATLFPGGGPAWGPPLRTIRDCDGVSATLNAQPSSDPKGESKEVTFRIGPSRSSWTYSLKLNKAGVYRRVDPGVSTYKVPPGEYVATVRVTTPTGCSVTAQDRYTAGAVTAYAPTVIFHPNEIYYPGNADDFIARSQLINHRGRCGGKRYIAAGQQAKEWGADQMRLLTRRLSGNGGAPYSAQKIRYKPGTGCVVEEGRARTNGTPGRYVTRKNDPYSGFYLNLLNRQEWREGNLGTARVYYLYKPERYIAYWIFSPFNRWTRRGVTEVHEGDWEHIVVKLGEDNVASRTAFFQHNCGPVQDLPWEDTPRDPNVVSNADDRGGRNSHPVLFSALGGHASYSRDPSQVGSNVSVGNCSVGGFVFNDRIGRGKVWRPWQERQLRLASDQLWYGYGGAWGDRSTDSTPAPGVDNYGPPAPGPKNLGVPKSWR